MLQSKWATDQHSTNLLLTACLSDCTVDDDNTPTMQYST